MFNAGILSAKPQQKLVNLFDYELSQSYIVVKFYINKDGTASYYNNNDNTIISGMWWVGPATANPGAGYEVRFTSQAGDTPTGSTLNSWLVINQPQYISYQATSGRTLIEIRKTGTTTVLASCRVWRGYKYAPT